MIFFGYPERFIQTTLWWEKITVSIDLFVNNHIKYLFKTY
jgi:hypothetical protein